MSGNGPHERFLCCQATELPVCFSPLPERAGALAGILGGNHVGTPDLTLSVGTPFRAFKTRL